MADKFDIPSLFSKPAKERLEKKRGLILTKMLVKKCPLNDNVRPTIIEDESVDLAGQVFDSEQDKVILDLLRKDYKQEDG